MASRPRVTLSGIAYHVMTRVFGEQDLFADDGDYAAFEQVLPRRGGGSWTRGRYCWMIGLWISRVADGGW